MKCFISCLTFLLLINCSTFNLALAAEDDLGLWTPIYIKLPVTKKIIGNFEVNTRLQENITDINQLLIRPSIGYKLNENLSVWQGHAWISSYLPRFIREQRIWQQILHEKHFSKFDLMNRTRFEERFIQNVEGVSLRGRHFLRAGYVLDKNKIWSLIISNELFVNLNSHFQGPQAGIDQNRVFAGINKKINNNFNFDLGYQLQYINNQAPARDRLNHVILANFYIDLPSLLKE